MCVTENICFEYQDNLASCVCNPDRCFVDGIVVHHQIKLAIRWVWINLQLSRYYIHLRTWKFGYKEIISSSGCCSCSTRLLYGQDCRIRNYSWTTLSGYNTTVPESVHGFRYSCKGKCVCVCSNNLTVAVG